MKDFLSFVRKPVRRRPRSAGLKTRAGAVLALLAFDALFALLVCVPTSLLLNKTIGLDLDPGLYTRGFMFSAVALAPFLEELIFRAGLRSMRWTLFGMPLMIALSLGGWTIALSVAAAAGIARAVDRLYQQRLPAEVCAQRRWKRRRLFIRHYPLVVYFYALLFAGVHFPNFILEDGAGWKSALMILAVMSQLMTGLVCSYLRLRHGLGSAMAAHFLWNACAIGISL